MSSSSELMEHRELRDLPTPSELLASMRQTDGGSGSRKPISVWPITSASPFGQDPAPAMQLVWLELRPEHRTGMSFGESAITVRGGLVARGSFEQRIDQRVRRGLAPHAVRQQDHAGAGRWVEEHLRRHAVVAAVVAEHVPARRPEVVVEPHE